MVRPFKQALAPFKIVLSLSCAAVVLLALAGATLIPDARAADLRLRTKPAVQQETPADRHKRLFEEFLRYWQKRNQ